MAASLPVASTAASAPAPISTAAASAVITPSLPCLTDFHVLAIIAIHALVSWAFGHPREAEEKAFIEATANLQLMGAADDTSEIVAKKRFLYEDKVKMKVAEMRGALPAKVVPGVEGRMAEGVAGGAGAGSGGAGAGLERENREKQLKAAQDLKFLDDAHYIRINLNNALKENNWDQIKKELLQKKRFILEVIERGYGEILWGDSIHEVLDGLNTNRHLTYVGKDMENFYDADLLNNYFENEMGDFNELFKTIRTVAIIGVGESIKSPTAARALSIIIRAASVVEEEDIHIEDDGSGILESPPPLHLPPKARALPLAAAGAGAAMPIGYDRLAQRRASHMHGIARRPAIVGSADDVAAAAAATAVAATAAGAAGAAAASPSSVTLSVAGGGVGPFFPDTARALTGTAASGGAQNPLAETDTPAASGRGVTLSAAAAGEAPPLPHAPWWRRYCCGNITAASPSGSSSAPRA